MRMLGSKVVEALGNVTEQYGEVNGAAQGVIDTLEETQSQKFQAMFRDMTDTLVPLGDILLEMGEEALPILEDAVDNLTDAWNDLSPDMQENIVQWGLVAAAAGPIVKVFSGVTGGLGAMLKLLPGITAGLGTAGVAGALSGVSGSGNRSRRSCCLVHKSLDSWHRGRFISCCWCWYFHL